MPRPEEAFGENDDCGSEDSETDSRRSVAERIASASKKNERQVAKPAECHERFNHRITSVLRQYTKERGSRGNGGSCVCRME